MTSVRLAATLVAVTLVAACSVVRFRLNRFRHGYELSFLPVALQQAQALSSLGSRPLIVVTDLSGALSGWSTEHDRMVHLSTNAKQIVLAAATHTSIISGDDSPVSRQAIVHVVASIWSRTALR